MGPPPPPKKKRGVASWIATIWLKMDQICARKTNTPYSILSHQITPVKTVNMGFPASRKGVHIGFSLASFMPWQWLMWPSCWWNVRMRCPNVVKALCMRIPSPTIGFIFKKLIVRHRVHWWRLRLRHGSNTIMPKLQDYPTLPKYSRGRFILESKWCESSTKFFSRNLLNQKITPRKINMEPENTRGISENHLPNHHGFRFELLIFGGVSHPNHSQKLNFWQPFSEPKLESLQFHPKKKPPLDPPWQCWTHPSWRKKKKQWIFAVKKTCSPKHPTGGSGWRYWKMGMFYSHGYQNVWGCSGLFGWSFRRKMHHP